MQVRSFVILRRVWKGWTLDWSCPKASRGQRGKKRKERTSWSPFWLPLVILGPPHQPVLITLHVAKNGEGRRGHEYNLLFMNFRYFSRQTCWCQHCGSNIWQSAPRPLSTSWSGSWTHFFRLKYEFIYMGTAKARCCQVHDCTFLSAALSCGEWFWCSVWEATG